MSGLPLRSPYTVQAVRDIMARCHGALILAFARWRDRSVADRLAIPTVWNHFEGAFAIAMKKEILVITEDQVAEDGITWGGGGQIILRAPVGAGPEWLRADYAKPQIDAWVDDVKRMDDVFLAYSSKARATANDIHKFLVSRGISVRDWEISGARFRFIEDSFDCGYQASGNEESGSSMNPASTATRSTQRSWLIR